VNPLRTGRYRVCKQVAENKTEGVRRDRELAGDAGDDFSATISEVGDRLLHTVGYSRYASGGLICAYRLEDRVDEVECARQSLARILVPESGYERRFHVVCDEGREVVECLGLASKAGYVLRELLLCRHSCCGGLHVLLPPRIGAGPELSYRVPREVRLRDEAKRTARVHKLCELASGLRRDQDDRRPAARKSGEPLRNVEAALGAEFDVDERDVRFESRRRVDGLVRRRGEANHSDPVVSEELPGGLEELRAVVNDQAGEWHGGRRGQRTTRIADDAAPPPDGERPSCGSILRYVDYRLAGTRCAAGCQRRSDGVDTAYMPEGERAQRVTIADDDVLLREGLAALLREGGYDVIGQASDADSLIELVRKEQPDIAIVDIRMPPTHTTEGLDAARTIREELPQVAILVLSAHIEVEHAMDLLGAGRGIGYLLKSRVGDVDELRDTLERISSGGSVVDPALVEELVRARRALDPLEGLTARERDVLAHMAEGRSNTGIAHSLWIAEGTVEKHVRNIFQKLQLPDAPDDHRRVLAVIAFLGSK
jgi:DNA-binding NarL/FixJ family response regulator